MRKFRIFPLLCLTILGACNNDSSSDNTSTILPSATPNIVLNYSVINVYPHDTAAYTEGFFLKDGFLYESTGGTGEDGNNSFIIKRTIKDAAPVSKISLPKNIFGEGISIIGNNLYELTWKEHRVFVYDKNSLKKVQEFHWPNEGWGMTTDGKSLIVSTGSNHLYYIDPKDFAIQKTINVTENGEKVDSLNELEYVDGFIYANIYQKNWIVKINVNTGNVVGKMDLSDIRQKSGVNFDLGNDPYNNKVLNGIAYDSTQNTLLMTGKNWPNIFELKLQ